MSWRRYVYRAVNQHGQVIDALVATPRDVAAARRLLQRSLTTLKATLAEVATDASAHRVAAAITNSPKQSARAR